MSFIMNGPFHIVNFDCSKPLDPIKGPQWPKQDFIKYAVYLNFTAKTKNAESQTDLNSWPFFRKLSIFLQTKNPNQCRIFHKKMIAEYSSIHALISELKSTIPRFEDWEQHYEQPLVNLQTCLNREREEAQKQLTNKNFNTKITIQQQAKKVSEIKFEPEELKKNEDIIPTDVSIKGEQKDYGTPFEAQALRGQEGRKKFDTSLIEESTINEDFNIFNRKPRSNAINFAAPNPFGSIQGNPLNVHNSFLSYLSQVQSLMGSLKEK